MTAAMHPESDRRVLDPTACAFTEQVTGADLPFKQWRVRAGETSLTFTAAADADDCAYAHNYMHGHLLSRIPGAEDLPLPADRRAPADPEEPVQLDADPERWSTPITDPDEAKRHADLMIEAAFTVNVTTAIDCLDRASKIELARGGHYRAADLHTLAKTAQEVLDR